MPDVVTRSRRTGHSLDVRQFLVTLCPVPQKLSKLADGTDDNLIVTRADNSRIQMLSNDYNVDIKEVVDKFIDLELALLGAS
jgi:hypothetical protein